LLAKPLFLLLALVCPVSKLPLTEHGLICTSTTSDNANHATSTAENDLLRTRGQLDTGLALVGVVSNNSNVVARGTAQRTTIAGLLFNVADNGTFGHGAERENVADCQVCVLASVDELSGVHALVGNESLGSVLEFVWVSENDSCKGSTTARVVDDLLDYTADVAMSLGEVELSELRRGFVEASVRSFSI
jgi:hypothetical protein